MKILALLAVALLAAAQQTPPKRPGYKDTPPIPEQKWLVHDQDRPYPRQITPGATPGAAPSDAIVLFDGKNLDAFQSRKGAAGWKVENGYLEVVPKAGAIFTKEALGDMQLHVEWASPAQVLSRDQDRGNSGIEIMGRYEIQVLDSWDNPTYADGQAGSIYGQWAPLVNAVRKPGEWQTYDIIFEAPKFEGEKLIKNPYVTVIHNGVLLHHRQKIVAPVAHRAVRPFAAHPAELPLQLQDHGHTVRYRNIWVRRLRGYDQP
jgi:hypothetical protein